MTQPDLNNAIPHYARYVKFFAAATGRTNGESLKSVVPMIIKDWPYDQVLCKAFLFRLAYALQQDPAHPEISDEVRESWSFMRPKKKPETPPPQHQLSETDSLRKGEVEMEIRSWNGTNYSSGLSYTADFLLWSPDSPQPFEAYCETEGPSGMISFNPCWSKFGRSLPPMRAHTSPVRSLPDNFGGFEAVFTWDGAPAVCSCGAKVRVRDNSPIAQIGSRCPGCDAPQVYGSVGRIWSCGHCERTGDIVDGKLNLPSP